jgi:hypothetical protein
MNPKNVVNAFLKQSQEDLLPSSIEINFIPHSQQRYNTDGDYFSKNNKWTALVTHMKDWRYSIACAIHELIEMSLTKDHGLHWDIITKYDESHPEFLDPGHHPDAPYHKEHMIAEGFEKQVIKMFGLNWDDYEKAYDELDKPSKQ